jgi:hypothetical protein
VLAATQKEAALALNLDKQRRMTDQKVTGGPTVMMISDWYTQYGRGGSRHKKTCRGYVYSFS